jgi:RHS repeat-associated protein
VTDSGGNKVGEMRYTPWGETRYQGGTTPIDYHYTGQREESGIGLYYYNARWYDAKLGRFAQADTVSGGGMTGDDRYSYVKNSPLNKIDPSGHETCNSGYGPADRSCKEAQLKEDEKRKKYNDELALFGVYLTNQSEMSLLAIHAILDAVRAIADRLLQTYVNMNWNSPYAAFKEAMKNTPINITWGGEGGPSCRGVNEYGCTESDGSGITFWNLSGDVYSNLASMTNNVVHEFGHIFQIRSGDYFPFGTYDRDDVLRPELVPDRYRMWQQSTSDWWPEIFADMFVAWVYNAWNTDLVTLRKTQLQEQMTTTISSARGGALN